jgi:hypothetical protein
MGLALIISTGWEAKAAISQTNNSQPPIVGAVTVSSKTITQLASVVILSTNTNRVGIECWTHCTNTDSLALAWGPVATSSSPIMMEQCSYWNPPVVSTQALSGTSFSGTQVIRCLDY